jgi:hypothetical protein
MDFHRKQVRETKAVKMDIPAHQCTQHNDRTLSRLQLYFKETIIRLSFSHTEIRQSRKMLRNNAPRRIFKPAARE